MAFKTLSSFNEERKGQFFTLRDDGEYADVIFLYRGIEDVLVADVHYVKSDQYSGYVHCCEGGCPACNKGLRKQTKLFIPLYNIASQKIEFWDRDAAFEHHLVKQVFANYPNPSEYVFRITRHGEYRSRETVYSIISQGTNKQLPYDLILSMNNITLPDGYSAVCREVSTFELDSMLNGSTPAATTQDYANYGAIPRPAAIPVPEPIADPVPDPVTIPAPEYGTGAPATLPTPEVDVALPDLPVPEGGDDSLDDLSDVAF
jgi:hypothetical protein